MARFVTASILLGSSLAFYLPGVAPRDYADGEPVDIMVKNIDSVKTQLPFDYYSLPFCQPDTIEYTAENLGEVLEGDDIENSPYEVLMQQTEACKILCRKTYDQKELALFNERVGEEYKLNWVVDNMPAGTKYYMGTKDEKQADITVDGNMYTTIYGKGFALGAVGAEPNAHHGGLVAGNPGEKYVNNHHRLIIFFHTDEENFLGFRVVGIEVQPFSIKHEINGQWKGNIGTKLKTCTSMDPVTASSNPQPLSGDTQDVIWTYDVRWEASEIKWASRWDLYLKMTNSQIHWFSIINSIVICFFLSAMVAMVLLRTLYRDLRKYNELSQMTDEEREEETGWKIVHGDVFRPPQRGWLLAVLAGTGVQCLAMAAIVLVFAALGFLSPANRGSLMTAMLVLFVFMGFFGGYTSTRVYLMFKLTGWKRNATVTALLFPGVVFGIFFFLNLVLWGQGSTGAVPFSTLLALLALWFCISYPLVMVGAWVASMRAPIEQPLRVNNIPRVLVPDQPWYAHPICACLLGGLLPFGAVFVEIFFLLSSVWMHRFYYVFGFLALVAIILTIICAEISIVLCYFQLCATDYHWWWRSFLSAGSCALYLFLYSTVYYFTKSPIEGTAPTVLFFGYTLLVCMVVFVVTGTIGFNACLWFVRTIYGAIKID